MLETRSPLAQINNVALMLEAVEKLRNRNINMPGLGVFYGYSGLGKSMAASFVAATADPSLNQNVAYVEMKSVWTKKSLLEAICKEINLIASNTCASMLEQIAEEVVARNILIIIDEFDYLVEKKAVSVIKDLHDATQGAILLIGEEELPNKLLKWEHFSNRILDFFSAQRSNLEDAKILRTFYSNGVEIKDCLLERILDETDGCIRRIVVNLNNITEKAKSQNIKIVSAKEWQQEPLAVGRPPKRKVM